MVNPKQINDLYRAHSLILGVKIALCASHDCCDCPLYDNNCTRLMDYLKGVLSIANSLDMSRVCCHDYLQEDLDEY